MTWACAGSRTLLTKTRLHLQRNQFYGLLGPNNCGKTTLMRAIGKEQVDGFPKRDELRTIFVEHEIEEREVGEDKDRFPILNIDLTGIDWVVDACNNVYGCAKPVTRESVAAVREEIGFGNSERGTGKATPKLNIWMFFCCYPFAKTNNSVPIVSCCIVYHKNVA